MEFAFKLLSEQSVVAFLQLWVGGWAKKQTWFDNGFIPVLTWVLAVLGLTLAPTSAHAAVALSGLAPVGNVMALALFQNLLVTGTHSTFKNTVKPAVMTGLKWLAGMVMAKLEKGAAVSKLED